MLGKANFTYISEVRHVVINAERGFKTKDTVACNVSSVPSFMQAGKFIRKLLGDRYRRAYTRRDGHTHKHTHKHTHTHTHTDLAIV